MSKYRYINTEFWDSDDYTTELEPLEKLLYLYAFTNPKAELCGAYKTSMQKIASETGIADKQFIRITFDKFERDEKIAFRSGWMIVANMATNQKADNPKVRIGINASLAKCPDWVQQVLLDGFGEHQPALPLGGTPARSLIPEPAKSTQPQKTPAAKKVSASASSSAKPSAAANDAEDKDSDDDDGPLPTIAVTKVAFELKKRMSIPQKGTLPNERAWEHVTRTAFGNGLGPDEVIEAFDLMYQQLWRTGPVTPKQIGDYLTPLTLNRLRDEIAQQGKKKEEANEKRNGNGGAQRGRSTSEREKSAARSVDQRRAIAALREAGAGTAPADAQLLGDGNGDDSGVNIPRELSGTH